ncbi:hypothetical protein BV20DRAFT_380202 [Pilatotrama ljubarskyi]|nr:hypothetical protein BV20DRAFT_380202 [Pilatotrama ljubarskyi]
MERRRCCYSTPFRFPYRAACGSTMGISTLALCPLAFTDNKQQFLRSIRHRRMTRSRTGTSASFPKRSFWSDVILVLVFRRYANGFLSARVIGFSTAQGTFSLCSYISSGPLIEHLSRCSFLALSTPLSCIWRTGYP